MKRIPLAAIGCAAALMLAPSATADSFNTDGTAADVIAGLKSQGYNVEINWTNGFATKPLEFCVVKGINNPSNIKPNGSNFVTVYVDVVCSNHDY